MRPGRRFGAPLLVIVLVIVVIASMRDFLLANLVQPVALLFWAIWRVAASVDQQVYWALVIAVGFMIMGQLFVPRNRHGRRSAYAHESLPPTRFEHWRRLIDQAADGWEERERLRLAMAKLLQTVVGQEHGFEINLLDERSSERPWSPPKVVRELLTPNLRPARQPMLEFVPRWIRRRIGQIRHTEDRWIQETIAWMESEMDINHGN